MTRRSPLHQGFTLIEMIATMVVISILSAFASTIILNGSDGYLDASATAELHTELSVALDRIVREVRRIDPDTAAGPGAPNIDSVSETSMVWRDADDDLYRLELTGSALTLAVDGSVPRTLLTDVTGFSMQARDDADAALPSLLTGGACDAIRRVEVSISLTRFGVTETLGAKVFIRSTMEGA